MKRRDSGFTLLELLVVIIIIVILASVAVVMAGMFLRGQGVRQGAITIVQAIARARQLSANQKVPHFITFGNQTLSGGVQGGIMKIYRDANANAVYDNGTDSLGEDDPIELPRLCIFKTGYPAWIGFTPSGYIIFPSGYAEVQAGSFDNAISGGNDAGELIIHTVDQRYYVCMDLDRGAGKVRRHQFLAK